MTNTLHSPRRSSLKKHWAVTLICLLLMVSTLQAQEKGEFNWGLRAGIVYGGPIPNEVDPDSSEGSPGFGPSLAATFSYQVTPRLRLTAEVGYSLKAVAYGRLFRQDTLVPIELLPGIVDTVPSFYYADVTGKMRLHYLEIPIMADYQIRERWRLQGGISTAIFVGGKDEGQAEIQIGEGGIFEDRIFEFENSGDINRFDFGFVLGGAYEFPQGWWIGVRGYRSVRDLYRKGFLAAQGLGDTRLYQTQFYLNAGYWF